MLDLTGGLVHRLDLAPGVRTWTDLASLASELDGRALAQPWPCLWVLPLAGLVDGRAEPAPNAALVRTVLAAGRRAWQVVVADPPPAAGPQVDAALEVADALLAVGRCHTAGVRGARAALDLWEAAGRDPEAASAVIAGVRSRTPLAPREARPVLGDRLWALVADDAAEFADAAEDGMLLDRPELSAVQTLVALGNRGVPFPGRTPDRGAPGGRLWRLASPVRLQRCGLPWWHGGWLWESEEVAGAVAQPSGEVVPVGRR